MQDTLNARFAAPLPDYYNRRIIVWMDEEGTFAETIEDMKLDNARVLVMRRDHMFELRRQIERDEAKRQGQLAERRRDNGLGDTRGEQ